MNADNMLNILLLNWNSCKDVDEFFNNSISEYSLNNFRVILIDNASSDSDIEAIRHLYAKWKGKLELHLLLNDSNCGYAGGNNRGYEYLKSKGFNGDILIVNPDIYLSNTALLSMRQCMSEDAGIVMCRTKNPGGKVIYDYITLNGLRQTHRISTEAICESDYAAGSCMLINRKVVEQIGLFDERFFMYWEEVDLSLRVRKLGYKIKSVTTSFVVRKENHPERNVNAVYYYIRNAFYLKKNHSDYVSHIQMLWFLMSSFFSQAKLAVACFQYARIVKYAKGLVDGLLV